MKYFLLYIILIIIVTGCSSNVSQLDNTTRDNTNNNSIEQIEELSNEGTIGTMTQIGNYVFILENVTLITSENDKYPSLLFLLHVGNGEKTSATFRTCDSTILFGSEQYDITIFPCEAIKVYPEAIKPIPIWFTFTSELIGGINWTDVPNTMTFIFETNEGIIKYNINKSEITSNNP